MKLAVVNSLKLAVSNASKTRFKLFLQKLTVSYIYIYIYMYTACTYKHFYPSWTDLGSFSSRFPLRFWVQYLEPLPCGRGHRLWKLWRKTRRWPGTFWWGKKTELSFNAVDFSWSNFIKWKRLLSSSHVFCFCGIAWLRNQRRYPNFCVSNLVDISVETNRLGLWKTGRSFPFGARRSFGA